MQLAEAQALKKDYVVHCPEDRGQPAFAARVTHVGDTVQKNLQGVEYVWVTTRIGNSRQSGGVWPSNRLR